MSRDVVGSFTVVGALGQPPNVNIIYSSNSFWRHLDRQRNLSVISVELVTFWLYRSQLAHGKSFHIWSKIWEGLFLIVVLMNDYLALQAAQTVFLATLSWALITIGQLGPGQNRRLGWHLNRRSTLKRLFFPSLPPDIVQETEVNVSLPNFRLGDLAHKWLKSLWPTSTI